MKEIVIIKRCPDGNNTIDTIFRQIAPMEVNTLNWPLEYSYCPHMTVAMFHDGNNLYVRYSVEEKCTRAIALEDNGEVWKDSCAELFIKPKGSRGYYNFEASCIGTLLLSHRSSRTEDIVMASDETLSKVLRIATYPHEILEEKVGKNIWQLTLIIPASALFVDAVETFDGMEAEMNVYKCGDNLSTPHYISLFAVNTPNPDFHRPEFFRNVRFE